MILVGLFQHDILWFYYSNFKAQKIFIFLQREMWKCSNVNPKEREYYRQTKYPMNRKTKDMAEFRTEVSFKKKHTKKTKTNMNRSIIGKNWVLLKKNEEEGKEKKQKHSCHLNSRIEKNRTRKQNQEAFSRQGWQLLKIWNMEELPFQVHTGSKMRWSSKYKELLDSLISWIHIKNKILGERKLTLSSFMLAVRFETDMDTAYQTNLLQTLKQLIKVFW